MSKSADSRITMLLFIAEFVSSNCIGDLDGGEIGVISVFLITGINHDEENKKKF